MYSKDDCGKLKSKDSNHTRRTKQNTYHVANKNIAPSKVTKERMPSRGIPKLRLLAILEYLGVPWASPSLGSCHSLFHNPSNLYTELENFTAQNLTENLVSSVSERKQTPLQGTVMNLLFIYIGVKPTVFRLLYGL